MLVRKRRKYKRYQIKKDYQVKSFENPFFRSDKKTVSHRSRSKQGSLQLGKSFYVFSAAAVAAFIVYGLFWSPLFAISSIKINGLGRLPESAIIQRLQAQASKKQNNLWLFRSQAAERDLTDNFNFSSVKISKKPFHTLAVEIEERPYAFIWSEAGQNYYSDSKGYIIKDSPVAVADLKKFPIIQNDTPNTLIDNGYLKVDADYLTFIFALKASLEKNPDLATMPIDRFLVSQELNLVKVKFQNGLLAYFNSQDDINKQIDKFVVVKKDKIKDNISKINYIDLRYGDKVYIGNKS